MLKEFLMRCGNGRENETEIIRMLHNHFSYFVFWAVLKCDPKYVIKLKLSQNKIKQDFLKSKLEKVKKF